MAGYKQPIHDLDPVIQRPSFRSRQYRKRESVDTNSAQVQNTDSTAELPLNPQAPSQPQTLNARAPSPVNTGSSTGLARRFKVLEQKVAVAATKKGQPARPNTTTMLDQLGLQTAADLMRLTDDIQPVFDFLDEDTARDEFSWEKVKKLNQEKLVQISEQILLPVVQRIFRKGFTEEENQLLQSKMCKSLEKKVARLCLSIAKATQARNRQNLKVLNEATNASRASAEFRLKLREILHVEVLDALKAEAVKEIEEQKSQEGSLESLRWWISQTKHSSSPAGSSMQKSAFDYSPGKTSKLSTCGPESRQGTSPPATRSSSPAQAAQGSKPSGDAYTYLQRWEQTATKNIAVHKAHFEPLSVEIPYTPSEASSHTIIPPEKAIAARYKLSSPARREIEPAKRDRENFLLESVAPSCLSLDQARFHSTKICEEENTANCNTVQNNTGTPEALNSLIPQKPSKFAEVVVQVLDIAKLDRQTAVRQTLRDKALQRSELYQDSSAKEKKTDEESLAKTSVSNQFNQRKKDEEHANMEKKRNLHKKWQKTVESMRRTDLCLRNPIKVKTRLSTETEKDGHKSNNQVADTANIDANPNQRPDSALGTKAKKPKRSRYLISLMRQYSKSDADFAIPQYALEKIQSYKCVNHSAVIPRTQPSYAFDEKAGKTLVFIPEPMLPCYLPYDISTSFITLDPPVQRFELLSILDYATEEEKFAAAKALVIRQGNQKEEDDSGFKDLITEIMHDSSVQAELTACMTPDFDLCTQVLWGKLKSKDPPASTTKEKTVKSTLFAKKQDQSSNKMDESSSAKNNDDSGRNEPLDANVAISLAIPDWNNRGMFFDDEPTKEDETGMLLLNNELLLRRAAILATTKDYQILLEESWERDQEHFAFDQPNHAPVPIEPEIFERLSAVWDKLEVAPHLRLEFVVKYCTKKNSAMVKIIVVIYEKLEQAFSQHKLKLKKATDIISKFRMQGYNEDSLHEQKLVQAFNAVRKLEVSQKKVLFYLFQLFKTFQEHVLFGEHLLIQYMQEQHHQIYQSLRARIAKM